MEGALSSLPLINYDIIQSVITRENLDDSYCVDKLDGNKIPNNIPNNRQIEIEIQRTGIKTKTLKLPY